MGLKRIGKFLLSSKGASIDMVDSPAAVIVCPGEGTLVFSGGCGISRRVVFGKSVTKFEVQSVRNGVGIKVSFLMPSGTSFSSFIGVTRKQATAKKWVERVNRFYKRRKRIA